jgi:hypothetical protein
VIKRFFPFSPEYSLFPLTGSGIRGNHSRIHHAGIIGYKYPVCIYFSVCYLNEASRTGEYPQPALLLPRLIE